MIVRTLMEMSTVPQHLRHQHERLAALWIDRVWRHGATRVEVMYAHEHPKCIVGLADIRRVHYSSDVVPPAPGELVHAPAIYQLWAGLKLYNLCGHQEPFLWLDWDAVPISDLDAIWKLAAARPFTACGHQYSDAMQDRSWVLGLTNDRHLNGGVMVVGDPSFLKWDELLAINKSEGRITWRYCDDVMLSAYCWANGYNFSHPEMPVGWNAWSRFTRLKYRGDYEWSGSTQDDRGEIHPAHVIHYYASGAKPWVLNCPLFAHHAGRKIPPHGHHPHLRKANAEPELARG